LVSPALVFVVVICVPSRLRALLIQSQALWALYLKEKALASGKWTHYTIHCLWHSAYGASEIHSGLLVWWVSVGTYVEVSCIPWRVALWMV
jgi:hypothetical protein